MSELGWSWGIFRAPKVIIYGSGLNITSVNDILGTSWSALPCPCRQARTVSILDIFLTREIRIETKSHLRKL